MIHKIQLPNDSKHIDYLKSEIERINRKLDEKITITISDVYVKEFNGDLYEVVDVTMYCPDFYLDGQFKAFAKIEHNPEGNIISQFGYQELNISQYYEASANCDVCNHNRRRNVTYLGYNGEIIIQVGTTCIKDITRLKAIVRFEEIISQFIVTDDDLLERFISGQPVYKTDDMIQEALGIIRHFGFVSKSKATWEQTPTVAILEDLQHSNSKELTNELIAEIELAEIHVTSIIDYWLKFAGNESSFKHSLSVIAKREYSTVKHLGILCAGVNMWLQEQSKQEANKEAGFVNEYFGTIGKRYNGLTAVLTQVKWGAYTIYNQYTGSEDTVNIITLRTDNGNALVIKSTSEKIADSFCNDNDLPLIGKIFTFNGKVKSHVEYNGLYQTVIQRPTKINQA